MADVDVWTVPLDRAARQLARDALRAILGTYLDAPPDSVEIETTPQGKPYLREGRLHFNLSHSRNIALVAISEHSPVGIDVEHSRHFRAPDRLARRICSEREYAAFQRSGSETGGTLEAQQQLLRLWVRKEAVLKGTGEGLAHPLREIDVLDDVVADGWRCVDLPRPAEGFQAALAVRGPAAAVSHHLFVRE
jgi:4'-phosphopantetheinyl transferase